MDIMQSCNIPKFFLRYNSWEERPANAQNDGAWLIFLSLYQPLVKDPNYGAAPL